MPRGKKLVTLRDSADCITSLPKMRPKCRNTIYVLIMSGNSQRLIVKRTIEVRRFRLPGLPRQSIRHAAGILPCPQVLALPCRYSGLVVRYHHVVMHRIKADRDSARVVPERRRGLH
jgi:hypothetical protein